MSKAVRKSSRIKKKVNYLELDDVEILPKKKKKVVKSTTPKRTPKRTQKKRGSKKKVLDLTEEDEDVEVHETKTSARKKAVKRKKSSTSSPSVSQSSRSSSSKKQKKEKATPEKRCARKRTRTSKVQQRIARAWKQRLFMISQEEVDEHHRKYGVLGSTGNLYHIDICKQPDCTCPDALKGNTCKHILFVFLKVLKQKRMSEYIYQKGLLTTELEEIFENAPKSVRSSAVIAPKAARKKYKKATGQGGDDDSDGDDDGVEQRKLEGDDCPICFESIKKNESENVVYCKAQCGNNIHKECFQMWSHSKRQNGEDVTCVYCRALWEGYVEDKDVKMNEGYQNFAAEAGVSLNRDTSDYQSNDWRSRGRYGGRYGYRWY